MATLLETIFSTDEKIVAQADVKFLGSMIELLVIKLDQENFEEFLSSDSKSPKATWQHCKVSFGTRSQVSSEASLKVTYIIGHNTSSPTSNEALKTSHVAQLPSSMSLRRPTRPMYYLMVKKLVKTNPAITLLYGLCNFSLPGVLNNPFELSRLLNIDQVATLVNNKLKTLQLQSVLQIVNARLRLIFFNARLAFIQ